MTDLVGRAAIVTGATKGIGLAIARSLVDAGMKVVVSARTAREVEEVASELTERGGGEGFGVPCDVRDPAACQDLVERAVEHFGRLDVLVNNAGVGRFAPIYELPLEDFRLQIETNLIGVFQISQAAIDPLRASGDGWIVNIGSLASRNSFREGTGYNASKFGLLGMSEAMMLDLRYEGIRVAIVMPGSVSTAFRGKEPGKDDDWKLRPEDVADSVLHLLGSPGNALVSRVEMRPSRPRR